MDMSEFEGQISAAIAAAERHVADLLGVPNVVSVGVGPERREGVMTGRAAVVVTVRRGADGTPPDTAPIPIEVDGVPVVVVEEGVPVEAPEIRAAQATAARVVERDGPAMLVLPGVTGVGVGYKMVGGQLRTTQIAIKVFVAAKLSPQELAQRGLEAIPVEIDGVPTDVEELPKMGPVASASGSRDDRKDPLVGGISIGVVSKPFWRGTLGAVVFDRTDGRQLVLSNQHVLDAPVGTDVIQPAPVKLDDSVEVGFQLNICDPVHFIRLDTPNTTVGTVLAGAAAAVALAAALSDTIDPTRRGQQATPPPAGAITVAEEHKVHLDYPELPIPGTSFEIDTAWTYTRLTDQGAASHDVAERRTNEHVLIDKLLLTDQKTYGTRDVIRLFGFLLPPGCAPGEPDDDRPVDVGELEQLTSVPEATPTATFRVVGSGAEPPLTQAPRSRTDPADAAERALAATAGRTCRCDRYHAIALLTPVAVDRAFPVVMREPPAARAKELLRELIDLLERRQDEALTRRVSYLLRYGCFRYGQLSAVGLPTGPWKHYFHVQTVNIAPDGMAPELAARIIGGLPVSQNMAPVIDVACGPVVFEDGQFDIEPIS
jgi:hypothetical protein